MGLKEPSMRSVILIVTLLLLADYAAALPATGSRGGSVRVAPRMLNSVRTKNIYGVNIGSDLTGNSRIFGDYDGLSNNYFGSPSSKTSNKGSSFTIPEEEFAQNCSVTTDSGGVRYDGGFGYENGFSACEAAEYEAFRKRQR